MATSAAPSQSPYDPDSEQPEIRPQFGVVRDNGEITPARGRLHATPSASDQPESLDANGQGGLRALEGGGETAPGRGNLRAVSGGGAGRALGANQLNAAENGANASGLYKTGSNEGEPERSSLRNRIVTGVSRRRLVVGGSGAGIAGVLVTLLLITPIYRVPAAMVEVGSKVGDEVDHVVENRAQRIIVRYLIAKASGNPDNTTFAIRGSITSDLWRTFQSHRIEAKIKQKTGISFSKGADGLVHIAHDGRDLGKVKNYEEVMAIIDHGTIKTRGDFKIILKTVIPAVRMHKAFIESRSLKLRYMEGKGYGAPEKEKDPSKTAAENAAKDAENIAAQEIDAVSEVTIAKAADALACGLDGDKAACDTFKQADPSATTPDPNSPTSKQDTANGSSKEVATEIESAGTEAKDTVIKDRKKSFVTVFIEKILAKLIGEAAAKTVTGIIPYVGWIDTLASIQHAIGVFFANDLAHSIPVVMKQSAYGAVYAQWTGYGDQSRAGKMPLTTLSTLTQQFGGSGGASAGGTAAAQKDQTVETERAAAYRYMAGRGINSGVPVNPKVGSDTFSQGNNIMDELYNNIAVRVTIRGPLEAWYYTVGKLLKGIGSLGSEAISFILKSTGYLDLQARVLKQVLGDNWQQELGTTAIRAITNLLGIAVDPLARGAALFNNIFTGGVVALNYHCHVYLGCRTLTQRQSTIVGMQLQKENDEDMATTPLKDRLFSVYTPNSLAGALVRNAPTDLRPTSVMASLFGQVARLPSSLLSAFSPKIRAADLDERSKLTGEQMFGATEDDLSQETAQEVRLQATNNVTCPQTDATKEFNACMADRTVIKSINCQFVDCPESQN